VPLRASQESLARTAVTAVRIVRSNTRQDLGLSQHSGYGSANDLRKARQAPNGVDRDRLELKVEGRMPGCKPTR
jgi:hypothetical protein